MRGWRFAMERYNIECEEWYPQETTSVLILNLNTVSKVNDFILIKITN